VGCPGTGPVINLIRIQNNSLVRTLLVPGELAAFFDHGARAVLRGGKEVDVLDTVSLFTRETATIGCLALAIGPDERRAYLLQDRAVTVVETAGACDPPEDGLANFWPADGNPNDVHRGYHASLLHHTGFAPGRIGQALRFDGFDDFAVVKGHWVDESGSFAVAAWVKFDSAAKQIPGRAHGSATHVHCGPSSALGAALGLASGQDRNGPIPVWQRGAVDGPVFGRGQSRC